MKTPTVLVLVVLITTVIDTAYPLSSGSKCAKGIQAESRRGLKGHCRLRLSYHRAKSSAICLEQTPYGL